MAIYNTIEHIDLVSDGVEYFDAFEPEMIVVSEESFVDNVDNSDE